MNYFLVDTDNDYVTIAYRGIVHDNYEKKVVQNKWHLRKNIVERE
jgi:hypothetical protein